MKANKVVTRISLSLAGCAATAVVLCFQFGLCPDWQAERIAHRAKLSESLAISLSLGPIQKGEVAARQQLDIFHRRFSDATSLGLRRDGGGLLTQVGNHEVTWSSWSENHRNSCFVVPIVKDQKLWGHLEIAYNPPTWEFLPDFLPAWLLLSFLIGMLVLCFSYIVLGRVLQHLDPSRIVPTRVRETLDSFAEGILLLDDRERIVLANKSFSESVGISTTELIGKMASDLGWKSDENGKSSALPWKEVAENQAAVRSSALRLTAQEHTHYYSVNSVPVLDDGGRFRGVMAAFADVTSLEEKKARLAEALQELRTSRDDIAEKNRELEFLATRDPLTGCLNRRSLFNKFEQHWRHAARTNEPLACIMVDIDFFKSINDNYGHKMGDDVLRETGSLLTAMVRECDLPSRYGGEEFCIVLPELNLDQAYARAEQIRKKLTELEFDGFSITASLGVSSTELAPPDPQGLIDQADKCLYAAKRNGRNQSVRFDEVDPELEVDESAISRTKPEDPTMADIAEVEIPYRSVSALLATLAYRDPETAAHSTRVADLSVAVGRRYLGPRDAYRLEIAALLHDIGKIGVPDAILLKPGPLTDDEWGIMKMHDRFGVEIVDSSFGSPALTEIVRHHHARYDKDGMEEIPLGARIVTIADAYDAMTNDRPYRKGMTDEEAFAELRRCAGKQFDPVLVEDFCELLSSTNLKDKSRAEVSHEAALGIGRQIESLVVALDNEDFNAINALSQRLSDTARQSQFTRLADAAADLAQASTDEPELVQLVEQTHELLELSRSMHSSVLERVSSSYAVSQ